GFASSARIAAWSPALATPVTTAATSVHELTPAVHGRLRLGDALALARRSCLDPIAAPHAIAVFLTTARTRPRLSPVTNPSKTHTDLPLWRRHNGGRVCGHGLGCAHRPLPGPQDRAKDFGHR